MADHDQALVPAGSSLRARTADWFEGTRLAELIDTIRSRPDTLGTFVVVLVTIAIYLFTSSRDRQNLDYFVRLADAFLHGRIYLTEAPSWLNELIPKDGVWYVAYPPMPAVLLVPFVAVFGPDFPQQIASCLFGGVRGRAGLAGLRRVRADLPGPARADRRVRLRDRPVVRGRGRLGLVLQPRRRGDVQHGARSCSPSSARWPFAVGLLLGCAAISRLPGRPDRAVLLRAHRRARLAAAAPGRDRAGGDPATASRSSSGIAIPIGAYAALQHRPLGHARSTRATC